MTFIPGWLVAALTFPGLIMHAAAWRLLCDLCKVPVYEISYVRGTLVHGNIPSMGKAILIAFAPLFVNTVLCGVIAFPAAFPLLMLEGEEVPGILIVLLWLSISMGMHAFPTKGEIDYFVEFVSEFEGRGFLYFIGRILGMLMAVVQFLRRIWVDAAYAIVVVLLFPWLAIEIATAL